MASTPTLYLVCQPGESGQIGAGQTRKVPTWVEHELSARLDTKVRLIFDSYPRDQVARSTVFAKLMGAEGMTVDKALAIAGLMEGDE